MLYIVLEQKLMVDDFRLWYNYQDKM